MKSVPVGVPFDGEIPAAAVVGVLEQLLGDVPGRGWVRIVVERDDPGRGAGTELHKLLGKLGFTATPKCKCLERMHQMDRAGEQWCEQHIDTIVGWLGEEAAARGLPFLDAAGRLLVRRAIHKSRRAKHAAPRQG